MTVVTMVTRVYEWHDGCYRWITMQRYQLTNEGLEKTEDIVRSLRRAGYQAWAEIGEIVTDAGLLAVGMVMGSVIRWIKI